MTTKKRMVEERMLAHAEKHWEMAIEARSAAIVRGFVEIGSSEDATLLHEISRRADRVMFWAECVAQKKNEAKVVA